jgi:hypothetical protein
MKAAIARPRPLPFSARTLGASFFAALALSACAPHPRYTPIYCVTPGQLQRLKDAEPPRVGDRLTGQAQDDFKIAAGSALELRAYSHGLLGVLEGCVEPSK